jgi:hypothetical protein
MHNYPQFTSVKESIDKKSRQMKNNLAEPVQKIRIAKILMCLMDRCGRESQGGEKERQEWCPKVWILQ